jgi:hypothetical protein
MRAWVLVLLLVLVGIVGAYVGYWAGHVAGWSRDAQFPLQIGGGEGAILLSIGLSFLSVMAALWWFEGRPLQRNRRLLTRGIPGHATILRVWRTGLTANPGHRHQLGVELDVHPDDRPAYTTKTTCLATDVEEATFTPGTEVDVRYDPTRPASVAIAGVVAPSAS